MARPKKPCKKKEGITTITLDQEFFSNRFFIQIDDEAIMIKNGKVYRRDAKGHYVACEDIIARVRGEANE